MAVSIGDVLDGKYRIVRVVGEGGMGTVYEGEYARLHRRVAVKVLLPSAQAEEIVMRFEREAQAAGRIGNEHIVEVFDLGTLPSGAPYMVTEFLDGTTLAQRIEAQGQMSAEDISRVAQQVLVALDAAHGAGIVHRDLKPDNVFLLRQKGGQKDFVKLIDFGISKFDSTTDGPAMKMTRVGSLLGTPSYMSPEIARGLSTADARTDIYGLGVIMYEAVARRLPYESNNLNDLLFKIVEANPPKLETLVPGLDPEFIALVTRAMAREPADRFPTAADFLAVLSDWMALRGIGPIPASSPSFSSMEFSDSVARQLATAGIRLGSRTPIRSANTPNPQELAATTASAGVPAKVASVASSSGVGANASASGVGVNASSGVGAGDSIARGWAEGTQGDAPPVKARRGPWIALAAGGLGFAIAAVAAFIALRSPAPTPANSSQSTTTAIAERPVVDAAAPVVSAVTSVTEPPVVVSASTGPATNPAIVNPGGHRPITGIGTRPVAVPASASGRPAGSAPRPPKAPDDEIPGMR